MVHINNGCMYKRKTVANPASIHKFKKVYLFGIRPQLFGLINITINEKSPLDKNVATFFRFIVFISYS